MPDVVLGECQTEDMKVPGLGTFCKLREWQYLNLILFSCLQIIGFAVKINQKARQANHLLEVLTV